MCQEFCPQWGACVAKGGMCGEGGACMARGNAWWGACLTGECVAGWLAWQMGDMHGKGVHSRGHAWQGACMAGRGHACITIKGLHITMP